jgi:hypothetical protein
MPFLAGPSAAILQLCSLQIPNTKPNAWSNDETGNHLILTRAGIQSKNALHQSVPVPELPATRFERSRSAADVSRARLRESRFEQDGLIQVFRFRPTLLN